MKRQRSKKEYVSLMKKASRELGINNKKGLAIISPEMALQKIVPFMKKIGVYKDFVNRTKNTQGSKINTAKELINNWYQTTN